MLLSVFTPSHKPEHLPALYKCLKNQTYTNWEWVVLANGNGMASVLNFAKELEKNDKRVKPVPYENNNTNIGKLKKTACNFCRGEVYVEVDHDDLITDDCLAEIAKAAEDNPKSFIYSDDVNLHENGKCTTYMPSYGWRSYPCELFGVPMLAHHTFKPTPRSLCEILFAPDHVRAWTRDAYLETKGHNEEMDVADDHELIVRTYLTGAKFVHIKKPLYIHRMWKEQKNTSVEKVNKIQTLSHQTRDKYLYKLVDEWCRREGYVVLDLAPATQSASDYLSVFPHGPADYVTDTTVNLFTNVAQDLLLQGKKVGAVRAFNFLQSIPSYRVTKWFNAVWGLLVPGGYLLTGTPAVCDNEGRAAKGAWQDPNNKSAWSNNNFWYYTDSNYSRFCPDIRCRYQAIRNFVSYPSDFHKANLIPYVYADLVALKEDVEVPGPVTI